MPIYEYRAQVVPVHVRGACPGLVRFRGNRLPDLRLQGDGAAPFHLLRRATSTLRAAVDGEAADGRTSRGGRPAAVPRQGEDRGPPRPFVFRG